MTAQTDRAEEQITAENDVTRCAVCGWPYAVWASAGCQPGNCSMRPLPRRHYAPERAQSDYQGRLPASEPVPSCSSCASLRATLSDLRASVQQIEQNMRGVIVVAGQYSVESSEVVAQCIECEILRIRKWADALADALAEVSRGQ